MGAYSNYYPDSKLFHGSLMNIMGTRFDALLLGANQDESLLIWNEIQKEIIRLEKLLNKFDEGSELANLNREAVHSPFFVSEELWTILKDCQRYWKLTLGYFDISLKDFRRVYMNETNKTILFCSKDIQLDLGGYAKGYALEKIRTILTNKRITQAFVNFGNSSVLALGSHPHGEYWAIGVNDPYNPDKTIQTIKLKDSTLSTSGNMPQHPRHILNPHTGDYNTERKIVTVATGNAIDAEALSTALMVANEQVAKKIVHNFKIDTYYIFNL